MNSVFLGLGSNVGNREEHLARAIDLLAEHGEIVARSRVYASPAMLPEDAPAEWNTPFLNMAIHIKTPQPPQELLQAIQHVEHKLGRVRLAHWSPREIDIDILLYNNMVTEDGMLIPHPGMLNRPFVLLPLLDIAADVPFPKAGEFFGKSLKEIAAILRMECNDACQIYEGA